MERENRERVKALQTASEAGVLIYQGGRLTSPEEMAQNAWVREEMAYVPDFIVLDEEGALKEIWYEGSPVKDNRTSPYRSAPRQNDSQKVFPV